MKTEWKRKRCGCVRTTLPQTGKVLIRCQHHRAKPYDGKRLLCYWDESGIAQREIPWPDGDEVGQPTC